MQTFSKANKGFTLIELMVVVAIVFMFAASISPRLVAVKNGQDFRQFVASLTSLPVYAREKSVSSGQKVELRFQGDTIQLVQVAVDLAETPIKTLPVLDGVRVSKAVKDKESAPT
ncbi:MAG: prepilin-type N-terminal cleavage/methylation domain-containing protein, partial [Armatimonadetes bacterium]|nr:prepilin-type N-terminal cleavage/methylation domain-containing protein [Armatimonadota bacterium]